MPVLIIMSFWLVRAGSPFPWKMTPMYKVTTILTPHIMSSIGPSRLTPYLSFFPFLLLLFPLDLLLASTISRAISNKKHNMYNINFYRAIF